MLSIAETYAVLKNAAPQTTAVMVLVKNLRVKLCFCFAACFACVGTLEAVPQSIS